MTEYPRDTFDAQRNARHCRAATQGAEANRNGEGELRLVGYVDILCVARRVGTEEKD